MNLQFDDKAAVEKLQRKYLERKKQVQAAENIASGAREEAAQRSKQPGKEFQSYNKALQELFKAVANYPDQFGSDRHLHCSNEDLSADSVIAVPLQDSQLLFTETDVTLPSCLAGSPGSLVMETDKKSGRAHQSPDSYRSSSLLLVNVYQEMMTIYNQLKTERQSQQQWEQQLEERERRLKQQEEALGRLSGLEEMLHTRIVSVEEKYQQEVSQLQDSLRQRNKENRRLRSSFDTIKELNDSMKKQLNDISEQNKKLESQSKRVQARLENLQRKYKQSMAWRDCQKVSVQNPECVKTSKKEKSATSGIPSNKGSSSGTQAKLLALLLDWVLDGQTFSSVAGNKVNSISQCLPPELVLNERCLKVLPLLADQLRHTPVSEADLLLKLLRLILWAVRLLDSSTQHVALSATLRRIGEEVSKSPACLTLNPQFEDSDLPQSCSGAAAGACRSWPLYRSPCPDTRILSSLIILRTLSQADVLAQALDSLHTELRSEESRGLFIHYGGVSMLLFLLRSDRGSVHMAVDILMQLTEPSRHLNPFLEACSCEEFFRTASLLLKNPRLKLPALEKLSILLQKLSSIRKNRRLFELSSLHLQIGELSHKTNHMHTFLCLNLRSILHNLE